MHGTFSDVVWQAIIAGGVTIVLAYIGTRTNKAVREVKDMAQDAAEKTEEVKTTLEEANKEARVHMAEIQKTGIDTHTLVNHNMSIQLKLNLELSRWKAQQTKDIVDINAANLAEAMYKAHIAKQAIVDSGVKTEKIQ